MFEELKYVFYPVADIAKIDFDCFKVNAPDDITDLDSIKKELRVDVATETQFILKYTGAKPRCIYGTDTYTHSQMLAIVTDPDGDWVDSTPE